jgi:hypothetical protein
MRAILLLIFILSFLNSDEKLVSSINATLQKVMKESTKEVRDIKVSYDPFNTNKTKFVKKATKKSNSLKKVISKKQPSKLALSMIFNKKAFINGTWYKENEKLADYRITRINKDIVVLKKNNKYTTLKLPLSDSILITKEEI